MIKEAVEEESILPVRELLSEAVKEYQEDKVDTVFGLKKTPVLKQIKNEIHLSLILRRMYKEVRPYFEQLGKIKDYEDVKKQETTRLLDETKSIVVKYMQEIEDKKLLFDQPIVQFFIDNNYLEAAEKFISKSFEKDGNLAGSEIFQGLQNAWVMHSFQVFWDLPLSLTPGVYSFSMLYPYTDNLLDSEHIPAEEKQSFNDRLTRFLQGQEVAPKNSYEARIYSLLDSISDQYPRASYPEVVDSIQQIQKAQVFSQLQADKDLSYEEILHLTFFKGGATLLADNYLVKGSLTEEEMHYSFQSGSFLQLLDDLSDIDEDRASGSQTIYTETEGYLDEEVTQLVSYIFGLNEIRPDETESQTITRQAMKASTLMMVMNLLGQNPDLVSEEFYKELESYSKVRLKYYKFVITRITKLLSRQGD